MVKYSRNRSNISIQLLKASEWKFCSLWVYLFTIPPAKNTVNLRENLLYCPTIVPSMEGRLLDRSETPFSSPLSAPSSLGLHDQSLFLLTELQTAWNQDEIGLQTEGNLSLAISLSLSPSHLPPSDT